MMGMVWVMARASDADVAALRADPDSIYEFVNSQDAHVDSRTLDLDKEWHAVHFLLTGSADAVDGPLSLIIGRWEEIGPDHGYGRAWLIPKHAIQAFHQALASRTDEQWASAYDAAGAVAAKVYIAQTLQDEGDEAIEFLQADITHLRAFVATVASANDNAFALIT